MSERIVNELANIYVDSFAEEIRRGGFLAERLYKNRNDWEKILIIYTLDDVEHITRLGPYYCGRNVPQERYTVKLRVNQDSPSYRNKPPFEPPTSPKIVIAVKADEVEPMGRWMARLVMAIHLQDSTTPELPQGIQFVSWEDAWLKWSLINADTQASFDANDIADKARYPQYGGSQ